EGEPTLAGPNSPIETEIIQMSLQSSITGWLGLAWCAGTQSLIDTNANTINDAIDCDGSGNQDVAQTDSYVATVTAYAVQQRNNTPFFCDEEFGEEEE
ncbi:MAG: hypothetical protein U1C53_00115, partial [Candidatus Veblenbacteria bacterium]|nr:hypothetical protein [Candidatus Veblenbacteria bacterium]